MKKSNSISDKQQELQKLYNSVGPSLITLYKTYLIYYANWCKDNNLVSKYSEQFKPWNAGTSTSAQQQPQSKDEDIDGEAVIYKHLPISSQLIHKFLIDTLIKKKIGLDFNNDLLQSLSQWIIGLIFITKLCLVHGNLMVQNNPIDEDYLYKVLDLHKFATTYTVQIPIYQISINTWNPNTRNLNPIHFKTANEKLRFLVDFHFATYLRLNFEERSNLKLCSLRVKPSNNINIHIPDSKNAKLDLIYYCPQIDDQSSEGYKDTALLPHQSPFLCPYTSLAASLFLRFYGILYFSRGEGFPDLYDDDYVKNIPLISNKNFNEYPRETTISICYSTMFRYCNLPYKKRPYFETLSPVFPSWSSITSYDTFKQVFPDDTVPWDYTNILNGFDPYREKIDFDIGINSNIPSQDIISLFFPEIEKYKAQSRSLSIHAQNFIQILETIRTKFVFDLPAIYKIFPEHDIFINPIFKDPKVQYYLNGIQLQDNEPLPFKAKLPLDNKSEDKTTLFDLYKGLIDKPSFLSQLQETNSNIIVNKVSMPLTGSSFPLHLSGDIELRRNIQSTVTINNQDELLEELRSENFKFIQYQTLHNFESFIELIGKIFNRLSLKESSRLEIERAMEHYKSLLNKKIQESTPDDIKQYFIDNPVSNNKSSQKKIKEVKSESGSDSDSDSNSDSDKESPYSKKSIRPFKVFSIGGESSDGEESDDDTLKSKRKKKTVRTESSDISEDEGDQEEDEDQDEGNEDNEDQEEQLKDMIDELVTTKVEILLKRQMEMLEGKLERIVNDMIESKLESKFDFFIENRMKRTVENYMRDNDIDTYPTKRVKKSESNFAKRVQNRTAALSMSDTREDDFQDSFQSETSVNSPSRITDEASVNGPISDDSKSNENESPATSKGFAFHITPHLDTIEDIVLEWFSPNPTMNNECIHSMNKKYGKAWRLKHDSIYRSRKNIVDFYAYLTNVEAVDKLQAITYCKSVQGDRDMNEFSKFLRAYKKSHNNTFEGLYQP